MTQTNDGYVQRAQDAFTPNYRPAPLVIDRGEGPYVYDVEGERYLDMIAGIAVSALGHNHPKLVEAITAQAQKVLHTSNLYLNGPSVRLAELLVEGDHFGERVYFCNSGAEANESAIKLARKYAHDNGDTERVEIVSFDGSFHGRTFAALTATAQPKYHVGFHPLPKGFVYGPFGDEAALNEKITEKTAAVIVEPIQGEGGVRVPPAGYLAAIRARCDEVGALLIFDEVQTGIGRTGTLFAHTHDGVRPDIMSLAKGIGGGLPLGGILTSAKVAPSLSYGSHATTYGGNPVACAAGAVVLEHLAEPGVLEGIRSLGDALMKGLNELNAKFGVFSEIRGRGLLVGAELAPSTGFDASVLVQGCRKRGVLVHVAGPRVVRFAPPLIIESKHVAEALSALSAAIEDGSSS